MIEQPVRVQLSRAKGWRMPSNTVKVDRATKWGNPFKVGEDGTSSECVELFRHLVCGRICLTSKASVELQVKTRAVILASLPELTGKHLACWCRSDRACHADVLLELANSSEHVL